MKKLCLILIVAGAASSLCSCSNDALGRYDFKGGTATPYIIEVAQTIKAEAGEQKSSDSARMGGQFYFVVESGQTAATGGVTLKPTSLYIEGGPDSKRLEKKGDIKTRINYLMDAVGSIREYKQTGDEGLEYRRFLSLIEQILRENHPVMPSEKLKVGTRFKRTFTTAQQAEPFGFIYGITEAEYGVAKIEKIDGAVKVKIGAFYKYKLGDKEGKELFAKSAGGVELSLAGHGDALGEIIYDATNKRVEKSIVSSFLAIDNAVTRNNKTETFLQQILSNVIMQIADEKPFDHPKMPQ